MRPPRLHSADTIALLAIRTTDHARARFCFVLRNNQ